jgi:hypothetical protein
LAQRCIEWQSDPFRQNGLLWRHLNPGAPRLTVALLVSLLAHTTLMFRLGEPLPLPVSKPEIPLRIVLNLSEMPLPPGDRACAAAPGYYA